MFKMRLSKCEKFLQSKCANCSLSFSKKNLRFANVDYGSESCAVFEVISYLYGISINNLRDKLVSYFNEVVRNYADNFLSKENETTISDFSTCPGFVLCRKCASVMTQMYKYHKIFNELSENDSFISEILKRDLTKDFDLFKDIKPEPVEFLSENEDEYILDNENEMLQFSDSEKNNNSKLGKTQSSVKSEKEEVACNKIENQRMTTRRMTNIQGNSTARNTSHNREFESSSDESEEENEVEHFSKIEFSDSDYSPDLIGTKKRKGAQYKKKCSKHFGKELLKTETSEVESSTLTETKVATTGKEKSAVGNSQSQSFGCSVCFEEFPTSHQMKWHKLTHFGEPVEVSKHVKGPPYFCPKCNKSYKALTSLQFHAMRKHKVKIPNKLEHVSLGWDCDDCLLSFSDVVELKQHYESIHNKKFFCKYCYISFGEENLLRSHLAEAHKKLKVDIKAFCKSTTFSKQRSKLKSRISKRPVLHYPCKKCGKVFSTPYKRKAHKIIHVEGVTQSTQIVNGPPFECPTCKKSYSSFLCFNEHSLIRHKLKYPSPVTGNCSKCDVSFSNINDLENHSRSVHGIEYFCQYCRKCFLTSAALQIHEASHEEKASKYVNADIAPQDDKEMTSNTNVPKSFQCRNCKQVFETYKLAKLHERMHKTGEIPRPGLTCEVCGKWFKNSSNFYSHKLSHSNVKPHMCDKCGRSFKHKNLFIRHANDHEEMENGVRPECKVCGKSFRHSSSLRRHKSRFHTGKRKPECPLCHKGFSNPYNVRVHLKICKAANPSPDADTNADLTDNNIN